jgi:hypothetical protein
MNFPVTVELHLRSERPTDSQSAAPFAVEEFLSEIDVWLDVEIDHRQPQCHKVPTRSAAKSNPTSEVLDSIADVVSPEGIEPI